jgi:hypothetical protein
MDDLVLFFAATTMTNLQVTISQRLAINTRNDLALQLISVETNASTAPVLRLALRSSRPLRRKDSSGGRKEGTLGGWRSKLQHVSRKQRMTLMYGLAEQSTLKYTLFAGYSL